ncbi:MAG: GNAT family N-acetyltransferase [Nitrospira sp.]|nr:GNAT family N-acetyltransferase [Nitrospira sp.]
METTFKIAEVSDKDILVDFMREFYAFEHLPFDAHVARIALDKILRNDSLGRVWLICHGSEAIGYVVLTLGYSLEYGGRDAFIDEIYLRENYRRQGIGTKALRFLEDTCRALEVQALHLEVERKNTHAQAFYRKVGFEDHDRYLMTRSISSRPE